MNTDEPQAQDATDKESVAVYQSLETREQEQDDDPAIDFLSNSGQSFWEN